VAVFSAPELLLSIASLVGAVSHGHACTLGVDGDLGAIRHAMVPSSRDWDSIDGEIGR